jgi:hypothetical protein
MEIKAPGAGEHDVMQVQTGQALKDGISNFSKEIIDKKQKTPLNFLI